MNKESLTSLKQTLQRNKEFTTLDVIEQLEQQIEKMKCCHSCKSHKLNNLKNCQTCDVNYSKWELSE